jgi:hypothetical protein
VLCTSPWDWSPSLLLHLRRNGERVVHPCSSYPMQGKDARPRLPHPTSPPTTAREKWRGFIYAPIWIAVNWEASHDHASSDPVLRQQPTLLCQPSPP